MRIKQLKLTNFRSYKDEVTIDFSDLNVFVGKNDIGKSTILEALDIFFNDGKGVVKLDKSDVNKLALHDGNDEIKISVIFSELPDKVVIDSNNETTFESEYLLNRNNDLEVIKKYKNAGKGNVFINAYHPTSVNCSGLFLKKNKDLKIALKDIECENKTVNSKIRKCIWESNKLNLDLKEIEIEITKIDEKEIWTNIKKTLPIYELFQSDRKNSDNDDEVQNPMKLAVKEILQDEAICEKLNFVAMQIEDRLKNVAKSTLRKLNDMNPDIAKSLHPVIPASDSLKWIDVFKSVSISDDNDIAINKRGSGVRRLVLLSFFMAEVDRRRSSENLKNIIYAIEEPETSQHPKHQNKLIDAVIKLSQSDKTQVLLTTHSPSVVKKLKFSDLKLITKNNEKRVVSVDENALPYPSLNEVNFLAFDESNEEYHNELYSYIESELTFVEYKKNKKCRDYIRIYNGDHKTESKILSEYIRHQIHHPENIENIKYTKEELNSSVVDMREFISRNKLSV